MSEWINVKDRLPTENNSKSPCENVIAYTVEGEVAPGWLNGKTWYLLVGGDDVHTCHGFGYVTHWMPMPQPPKEGDPHG